MTTTRKRPSRTRAPAGSARPTLARAQALGLETCGRIAAFWGFTRTMGRTFGLLYLSPQPLTRPEIQRRLAISVGSASMTLVALERWSVVHRVRVHGQRAQHYAAETDFWKMIARVLDERERREIATAVRVVEQARAAATRASANAATRDEAAFVNERLDRLRDICLLGQTMLDMLLGQLKLDVARFRDVLRVPAATTAPTPPPETQDSPAPPRPPLADARRTSTPVRRRRPRAIARPQQPD